MRFEITVKRGDSGARIYVEEEDLEKMFTKETQIMILKAYAQAIEESLKREKKYKHILMDARRKK